MSETTVVALDNDISVIVTRMSEQDMLRAASIFDPEKAQQISETNAENVNPRDLIDLWRGNERYLLYIVECACQLKSPLPKDDTWLSRMRRHADLYGIAVDDLVYLDYKEAVYIRYVGMTSEEFVSAVTNVAMGIDPETTQNAQAGTRRRRLTKNEGDVQASQA